MVGARKSESEWLFPHTAKLHYGRSKDHVRMSLGEINAYTPFQHLARMDGTDFNKNASWMQFLEIG